VEDKPERDVSGINLDQDVLELIELLAQNAHETWAELRLTEAWRRGPAAPSGILLL